MILKKGQLVIILYDVSTMYGFSPGKVGKLAFNERDAAKYLRQFPAFSRRNIDDNFHLLELPEKIIEKVKYLSDIRNMLNNFKESDLGSNFFIHKRKLILPIPKNEVRPPQKYERDYVYRMWNNLKKGIV